MMAWFRLLSCTIGLAVAYLSCSILMYIAILSGLKETIGVVWLGIVIGIIALFSFVIGYSKGAAYFDKNEERLTLNLRNLLQRNKSIKILWGIVVFIVLSYITYRVWLYTSHKFTFKYAIIITITGVLLHTVFLYYLPKIIFGIIDLNGEQKYEVTKVKIYSDGYKSTSTETVESNGGVVIILICFFIICYLDYKIMVEPVFQYDNNNNQAISVVQPVESQVQSNNKNHKAKKAIKKTTKHMKSNDSNASSSY